MSGIEKEWLTPAAIAAMELPDTPTTKAGVINLAKREGWQGRRDGLGAPLARRRRGRGGGWEYHWSLLPLRARLRLTAMTMAERAADHVSPDAVTHLRQGSGGQAEMWSWFERLPEKRKDVARARLAAIEAVEALVAGGVGKDLAVHEVARSARAFDDAGNAGGRARGVSPTTLWTWLARVAGKDRSDWLPYLASRHLGRVATAACDERAWQFLKADYLRLSAPSFMSCYERLKRTAAERGWPIPSARTLERRIEREIPPAVAVLLRQGEDALKRLYPAQERDRTVFHALEAVNVDGHKWDVFVRWPDDTVARPIMVAIQDLYSNKILAWRVDRTENADLVRLAFADVFRRFGVPEMAWLDNGRAFAAKCISGGATTRFRFKVKPEDPTGVLTALGVAIHWTKPYSGQSKPIERAFRDFCDAIAKHPAFEGAYTGNRPDAKPENYGSRAVPLETFVKIVDQGIRLHNAKAGRRTRVCRGALSFDQAFEESYARALIRKAGEEHLRMCLLAAESVTADGGGAVRLLGNRYWAEGLACYAGQGLTLRFDPDDLHAGVHVYRRDGAYVGFAECLEAAGFADTEAAREHGRKRRQFIKATRAAADLERQLSTDDLVRLLPEIEEPEPPATKTVRLVVGNLAAKPAEETQRLREAADEAFFKTLGQGLRLVQGEKE